MRSMPICRSGWKGSAAWARASTATSMMRYGPCNSKTSRARRCRSPKTSWVACRPCWTACARTWPAARGRATVSPPGGCSWNRRAAISAQASRSSTRKPIGPSVSLRSPPAQWNFFDVPDAGGSRREAGRMRRQRRGTKRSRYVGSYHTDESGAACRGSRNPRALRFQPSQGISGDLQRGHGAGYEISRRHAARRLHRQLGARHAAIAAGTGGRPWCDGRDRQLRTGDTQGAGHCPIRTTVRDQVTECGVLSAQNQASAMADIRPTLTDVPPALCLLVVDDAEDNRLLLKAILERAGHRVLLAANGAEAVAVCQAQQPAMVLLDVMMPVMDGYEAARLIIAQAGRRFVPILFLTALTDDRQLAKCLEVGGDDFIVKPINQVVLKAKLLAMQRLRALYGEYECQQWELQALHDRLRYEHEVAEHVFARIVGNTAFNVPNIEYELSPMAIVNGDLILVMTTPAGNQLVLLVDFAGHGFSAAIGAIPASTIFRAMAGKGLAIEAIVAEINHKLHEHLPTGQYLAACLLERSLRAASRKLPLGVVGPAEFAADIVVYGIKEGDRIIAYSDGLIEARNNQGDMFGQERLERLMGAHRAHGGLFAKIRDAVRDFRGAEPQNDDITLIEMLCDRRLLEGQNGEEQTMGVQTPHSTACKINLNLGAQELAVFDPLTLVVALVNCVPALKNHQSSLYVVLVELYMNALDHGVLRMDSSLKKTPEGFSRYYAEREPRLAQLSEGWINIDVEYCAAVDGGQVLIGMTDSGSGFDQVAVPSVEKIGGQPQGRGIILVRALCESVMYNERGNAVKAVYRW